MKNKENPIKILNLGDNALVGFNLVYLLRKNNISADYLNYYNSELSTKRLSWVYTFHTNPRQFLNKLRVIKESIVFCKNYDVIHAHNIFGLPLLFVRKPFFLHIHGSDIRIFARKNDIIGFCMRRILKRADVIFVATPDLLDEVKKFECKGIFLPNPIDFETFKSNSYPTVNFRKKNEIILFHPARHTRVKRNDILIKAFFTLVKSGFNVKLIMVKWGDLLEESKTLVNQLNINEHIIWIDPIPSCAMNDFINACDIVCDQFEIDNGLGLITLEAMACSKPVITKFSPEKFNNGYVKIPPLLTIKTEEDLTQKLLALIRDEKYRGEYGMICNRWVAAEHSPTKILSIVSSCYENLSKK